MSQRITWLAMMLLTAGVTRAESVLSDSSKVYDIDEVIIVSQPKEAFRLRQQPLSSTTFGNFELNRLGAHDLREVAAYVPNFVMPNYGSRLSSAIYVRGIGSRVNSPAVGVYMDGIPVMSKSAFNLHNYQLSRIDVLRGPQGTLYGQNTEGGLIRLYSRNPFDYQGTDVKLSYGSRNYCQTEVAHYTHLGSDMALMVGGFYQGQKGFFRNATTGQRADDYQEAGGKFMLMGRLHSGWSINLLGNYQYVDQSAFPYGKLDLKSNQAESTASTFPGSYRRNNLITGLTLHYDARAFSFASTTSYQYLKDHMYMDQDYLAADYMRMMQNQLQNAFTQEFSFKSRKPVGGIWNWATGAFFSAQWLKTQGPVFFESALTTPIANAIQQQMYNTMVQAMAQQMMRPGMTQEQALALAAQTIQRAGGVSMAIEMGAPGTYRTPQYNIGFYHESNLQISPRLILTLGARYDYMQARIHYESMAYMTAHANVMGRQASYTLRSMLDGKDHLDFEQLLPKLGLSYQLGNNGSNIYASLSKGYRAGGYNIQMFSDILQAELNANRQNAMRGDYDVPHTPEDYERVNQTIAYKPETSWNYEVGTHLNLFEGQLHLDLSTYYMKVRNQQLSVMAGNYGFGRMMVNAGKSHTCGLELSAKGQCLDGNLDWMLSYGYTRAIFDEYRDGEGDETVSYADKYVPYVPQHTMAASADYHIPMGKSYLQSITLGANVQAQGKTYWDPANSYAQKLYAVLGAHVDADMGMIGVSLWARNLSNTYYNTFAVDNAATGTKQYFAQRGNPFQCGVDIKLHF